MNMLDKEQHVKECKKGKGKINIKYFEHKYHKKK